MNYVKLTVFLPVTKKSVLRRQFIILDALRFKLYSLGVFDIDWLGSDCKKSDACPSDIYIDLTNDGIHRTHSARVGAVYLHRTLESDGYTQAIFENELRKAIESVKRKRTKLYEAKLPSLYHISFDNFLPSVLEPRQPYGSEIGQDENDPKLMEDLPPRVSFSSSIEGCFRAITPNIMDIIRNAGRRPLLFRVYKAAIKTTKYKCLYPCELNDMKAVHDAQFTQEYCFMKPVYIRNVADIEITVDTSKKIVYGFNGGPNSGTDTGWAHDMSYEIVKFKSQGYIDMHKYDFYFRKIV